MQIILLLFPLISLLIFVALVQWVLLSPEQPVTIFPGVRVQGLIHRYRLQWMRGLARTVAGKFNPFNQLEARITNPDNFESIKPVIEDHMDDFLRNRLKDQMPMISMFIGDKTIASLKTIFIQEIEKLFPRVISGFATNLQKGVDVESLIFNELEKIPPAELSAALRTATRTGFRRLYLLALLLGLLLGALQLTIFLVWG
ncbi:MAG: DUF445 domain-containing protein [Chitinophagaceae bacterium]